MNTTSSIQASQQAVVFAVSLCTAFNVAKFTPFRCNVSTPIFQSRTVSGLGQNSSKTGETASAAPGAEHICQNRARAGCWQSRKGPFAGPGHCPHAGPPPAPCSMDSPGGPFADLVSGERFPCVWVIVLSAP